LPAQPPMAEAKFFAFCNKSASGIVGLVIFILVTVLHITIDAATIN
jgi:flagellin-like protein